MIASEYGTVHGTMTSLELFKKVKSEIERVSKLMAFVLPSDKLQKKAERVESKPDPSVAVKESKQD